MRRAGDRVADPRRSSPSRDRGRAAGLCRALAVRRTIGKALPCAPAIVRIRACKCKAFPGHARQKEARRPAARTPNLPSSRGLRRAPLKRRIPQGLGDARLSHAARPGNAPRSRNDLAQSSEWGSRGAALGEAVSPEEVAACRQRLLPSSPRCRLAGPDIGIARSRACRAPKGGSSAVDCGRSDAETSRRPAGSATYLRPTRGRHRAPARVSYVEGRPGSRPPPGQNPFQVSRAPRPRTRPRRSQTSSRRPTALPPRM